MNQLTTTAKVKTYLGITDSDSDTVIDALVLGVSEFIAGYCGGRKFEAQDLVEVYDTKHGRHKIFLKQFPVNSVTAVKYRGGTPSTPNWITYNVDSYLTYLEAGYIHFYGALPQVAQGMQISYNAGYLIDFDNETDINSHTLPADLSMAATDIVAVMLNTRKSGGITNETTEGQSITYDFKRGMSQATKNIIDRYKIYRIAA